MGKKNQCFKNRTGLAGSTVNRSHFRSDLLYETIEGLDGYRIAWTNGRTDDPVESDGSKRTE